MQWQLICNQIFHSDRIRTQFGKNKVLQSEGFMQLKYLMRNELQNHGMLAGEGR